MPWLLPYATPLNLNNFWHHSKFYSLLLSLLAIPFISGAAYGFGEAWARIVMGRLGYLPRVLTMSGKPVQDYGKEVVRGAKREFGNIPMDYSID